MPRLRTILLFLGPVSLAWVLSLALTLSGFALFMFALLFATPALIAALIIVVAFSSLWLVARRSDETRSLASAFGALALGIAVGVVAFIPMALLDGPIVHAARQPVRELLAVHVIERSHARHDSKHFELQLHGIDALLSQDGRIEVYPDASNTSVVFWDVTGVMSGYASVYAEDARASQLAYGLNGMNSERGSGHWWYVWED